MAPSRPKKPKVPQANAFAVAKRNALEKLDKSPKGSIDAPIAALVSRINRHPDFFTTSSCSGRIVLFHASSNRGGRWLLSSHATVTTEQVATALTADQVARSEVLLSGDEPSSAHGRGEISLKMEPGILHVQCRDVAAAKWLLQIALKAGFRESGLVLSESSKVMLAIRTSVARLERELRRLIIPRSQRLRLSCALRVRRTSNSLELPVAAPDPAGRMQTLVPPDYLAHLVEHANFKFEVCLEPYRPVTVTELMLPRERPCL